MYGLIFENFAGYLKVKYGEEAWDNVRRLANIDSPTFSIHQVGVSCQMLTDIKLSLAQNCKEKCLHFVNNDQLEPDRHTQR